MTAPPGVQSECINSIELLLLLHLHATVSVSHCQPQRQRARPTASQPAAPPRTYPRWGPKTMAKAAAG